MAIRRNAFTLTELLLALGIVGMIAVLAIPSLVKEINNNANVSKLKNFISSVEVAIIDQMSELKTKDLSTTAFGDVATLFSSVKFDTALICNSVNVSKCWGSTIKYKTVGGSISATWGPGTVYAKLKSGIALTAENLETETTYFEDTPREDAAITRFCVDLNGGDKPNIIGRDAFCFYITRKGNIVGSSDLSTQKTQNELKAACITGSNLGTNAESCFAYLLNNNWEIDY